MSRILLASLALWAACAHAAEYRFDAGLAVVAAAEKVLDGSRQQVDYKLLGAAKLRAGQDAQYGSMTCSGSMIRSNTGSVEDDRADCTWTTAAGDRIAWRYVADHENTGPGLQRARLEAVSGAGQWQRVSGRLTTDVMFKPRMPDAPVLFLAGVGELATERHAVQ